MAVTHALVIGYFDTRIKAAKNDLGIYDEIFTSGYSVKNDGGGGHYKRYNELSVAPVLGFISQDQIVWGLIPDGGVINPLQAGANGDGANDQPALQECIAYIKFWNTTNHQVSYTTVGGNVITEADSSRTAVRLVIPANRTFIVDRTGTKAAGLDLNGPITIEGEDRFSSVIRLKESTTGGNSGAVENDPISGSFGVDNSLFYSTLGGISGIRLRNFTLRGSYGNPNEDATDSLSNGDASLFTFHNFTDVLFEDLVFTRNRAVIVNGAGARNLTMRGCLMSESRRGGLIITEADNTSILFNDFRWIADDPVAITMAADTLNPTVTPPYLPIAFGGLTRIVGNRLFGCRGLNVVGAKNVLIEGNICVLCRGRAIHIGVGTDQDKGDTTMLNIIVRANIITDLLDAQVDPEQAQDQGSHRAIDIEMLQTAPNPVGAPGLPDAGGAIVDPTQYHYKQGQGLNGRRIWKPGDHYIPYPPTPTPANPPADQEWETWWLGRIYRAQNEADTGTTPPTHTGSTVVYDGGGTSGVGWLYAAPQTILPVPQSPTPHSGNILIEGNIIARTRPPAVPAPPPGSPLRSDHIAGFDNFESYGVGPWGGFDHIYDPGENVTVTLDQITPDEGIGVGGSVRNLIIRGNQIRNCDVAIRFYGKALPIPFTLLDVTVIDNDLSDWKTAGIRFDRFDSDPGTPVAVPAQRVSILNNRADGDPFHWNRPGVVRMPLGKWANTTADIVDGTKTLSAGYGAFVDATGLGHVLIAGNHVRNAPQLVAGLNPALHTMEGNFGYCNPVQVTWHANNVGVGILIDPQLGWRYVIEGGNPTSPNWGMVLNTCPLAVIPSVPNPSGTAAQYALACRP